MLGLSPPSIRKYLKLLIDEGWVDERTHPTEKWDKTTQYRVNLRRVQEDLLTVGRTLPEVYVKAFGFCLQDNAPIRNLQKTAETSKERNFASNIRNFASNEKSEDSYIENPHFSAETSNIRNFASKVRNFGSNEKSCASNQRIFASNTENTHKNTNKEYTHNAREFSQNSPIDGVERAMGVCENFEKSAFDKSVLEKESSPQRVNPHPSHQRPSLSVSEAMVQLWKKHVCQEVLTPTKRRSHLLESVLQLHFEHDLKRWEAFCERVKNTPFLTGQGPNGWWISLDWLLREGNILKVLERNFDSSEVHEKQQAQLAKTDRELKMQAILGGIEDSVWKDWCTQLAFPPPLPPGWLQTRIGLYELEDISKARFVEFDGRAVVVETTDKRCHNRIQDLRLQILPVIQRAFPKARSISSQLIEAGAPAETGGIRSEHPPLSQFSQQLNHNKGEIHE